MASFTYTPLASEEQAQRANALYDYYKGGGIFNLTDAAGNKTSYAMDREAMEADPVGSYNRLKSQGLMRSGMGNSNYLARSINNGKNNKQQSLAEAGKAADQGLKDEAEYYGYKYEPNPKTGRDTTNYISGAAAQGIEASRQGMGGGLTNYLSGTLANLYENANFTNPYETAYQSRIAEDIMAGRSKADTLTEAASDPGYLNFITNYYDMMKAEYDAKNPKWSKIDYPAQAEKEVQDAYKAYTGAK